MGNVEEVRQLDDKHLEWKAKVAGTERRWKAEIVEQKPNQVIAWRAITGDKNQGKVEFQPIDGRTMVKLALDYDPPAGIAGEVGDKLVQATREASRRTSSASSSSSSNGRRRPANGRGEIQSGQVRK